MYPLAVGIGSREGYRYLKSGSKSYFVMPSFCTTKLSPAAPTALFPEATVPNWAFAGPALARCDLILNRSMVVSFSLFSFLSVFCC
jgi:hypothetical protein